jgi:predicted nucleotidyltransferase
MPSIQRHGRAAHATGLQPHTSSDVILLLTRSWMTATLCLLMPNVIAPQFRDPLVDANTIIQLARSVAHLVDPERIILFGSFAYGDTTEDSDVDLFIVMPHRGPGYRTATRIRLAVEVKFPMDLLVLSAAELRKGLSQRDWFVVEVLEKGIVLHDRTNPAVGAKGRSRLRRRLAPAAIGQT